jgi:HK97 family phage portal protein
MLQLISNPNSYQSQSLFIEAVLSFYYIFGEGFTAFTTLDKTSGSINAGTPMRLDALPPQWIKLELGDYFNPIRGYTFYPFSGTDKVDYLKEQVFHWREFNPDYTRTGGHLRGTSRLKPLVKTITGSEEGYNSLVKAFQAQGMWGIVTMLEPDTQKAVDLSKEQKGQLKAGWKRDMKKGDLTVSNSLAHYEKMGLDIKELRVLEALSSLTGKVCNVFNVPDQLFAGSLSKTYLNFKEAERALWANAIKPSLDAFLAGLTNLLAPNFKGEEETHLRADYSGIEALQYNMVELVGWMIQAQGFTKNEIREAAGYEVIDLPEMNEVFISAGQTPITQSMTPPDPALVDNVMKELGMSDYRQKIKVNGN